MIVELSAMLRSGEVERTALTESGLPEELLLAIEAPSLPKLAETIQAHPHVYWHPLVGRQIRYLDRLCWDRDEWARRGWEELWKYDEGWGDCVREPPAEVADVERWRVRLLEAHVRGFLPGHRVERPKESEGASTRSGLVNPYPRRPMDKRIDASRLEEDWTLLRTFFRRRRRELEMHPPLETAVARVRRLVDEALRTLSVCGWSSLSYRIVVDESPLEQGLPEPPPGTPELLRRLWSIRTRAPVIECWKGVDFEPVIRRMLDHDGMRRLKSDGRPAFLAYGVLGTILNVPPEDVRDRIAALRRSPKK
jgi:hypothetical protein